MFKVLVLGSTGFVGGHVMNYLGGLGYEVDTLSTAEFLAEDWKRLDDFRLEEGVKPDYLINCAWIRNKDLHATDHLEMAEAVCNLYQECANRGIKAINLGSSSEYGVKSEAMREDMMCEPINTYGIAKLSVTLFAKKLGFNTLRLFTVTGKGGHSFKDNYEGVEKWSNPNAERDYVHIDEVVSAIENLMHGQHIYGEIINLCSGEGVTNGQLAEPSAVGQYEDDRWHTYPVRQYERSDWVGDTTKMNNLLNIYG
jgi:nucleoside-diphosphate-sugar epimerase